MKEFIKNMLKRMQLYHPLQSFYRAMIFTTRNKLYRWRYKKYAGSGYTCNVCAATYQKFIPEYPSNENKRALAANHVIAGYGENILCPNCMSTSRERMVICFLTDKLIVNGKKVLHLSPEKNIYQFLKIRAVVTTADLIPGFYKTVDGLVQMQDATHFNFDPNSFDMVIGNHILEHIPDDRKAMKEINRVLKPGGHAILQVPFSETNAETIESPGIKDPVMQSKLYGQKDHMRIYTLKDYISRLQQSGFDVEIIPYRKLQAYYSFAIQEGECFLMISKPV